MNPIVRELWEQRQKTKQRMMSLTDQDSDTTGAGNIQELTANLIHQNNQEVLEKKGQVERPKFRHPSDSKTIIDYNFKSDEFLREAYMSPRWNHEVW
jgi:hypothetical protein